MTDTTPNEDDLITVAYTEALLVGAFPVAPLKKGTAIGRRVSFGLEFGEFELTVTLPAESNIRKGTTFVFRRRGKPDEKTLGDYMELLPEPMRVRTGHGNAHTFLTREFTTALAQDREPAIDLYEPLAMTVPGIVANESAKKGGVQLAVPSFDPA